MKKFNQFIKESNENKTKLKSLEKIEADLYTVRLLVEYGMLDEELNFKIGEKEGVNWSNKGGSHEVQHMEDNVINFQHTIKMVKSLCDILEKTEETIKKINDN